jgi:hypothetical protein
MPALDAGIHALLPLERWSLPRKKEAWMAASSAAMTAESVAGGAAGRRTKGVLGLSVPSVSSVVNPAPPRAPRSGKTLTWIDAFALRKPMIR